MTAHGRKQGRSHGQDNLTADAAAGRRVLSPGSLPCAVDGQRPGRAGSGAGRQRPAGTALCVTMVGLGPPPLAAVIAAPAGAIWLAETSSPATARTMAISTIRILERRMLWMMSTAVLHSCCCENPPPGAGMFASVESPVGTPACPAPRRSGRRRDRDQAACLSNAPPRWRSALSARAAGS